MSIEQQTSTIGTQIAAYLLLTSAHYHSNGAHLANDSSLTLQLRADLAKEMNVETLLAAFDVASLTIHPRY